MISYRQEDGSLGESFVYCEDMYRLGEVGRDMRRCRG